MGIAAGRVRSAVTALGVLLAVGAFAFPAQAAKSISLDGTFKVTVTVTDDDDPSTVGAKGKREYKFSCLNKQCSQVRFLREGANGVRVRSQLKRTSSTTFKGTEHQKNPECPDGSRAESRVADIVVEITKAKKGFATAIKGEAHFKTKGCADDKFQDGTFIGKVKKEK